MSPHSASNAAWIKSRWSEGGGQQDCVEIEFRPNAVAVRDSKNRHRGELTFSRTAWTSHLALITDPAERATWPMSIYVPGRRGDKDGVRPLLDLAHADWRGADPNDGARVEYAFLSHAGAVFVAMRNSAEWRGELLFDAAEWSAFVLGAMDNEFNPALTPA
ncbi:DUF397 domain-containing protein [Crossiella sp. CA198]|uniref:DUF397 domain-containing protein n=1 Tax=Crossiella sp. CA198 TaxID=3455607 RepID=UPI003F8D1A71